MRPLIAFDLDGTLVDSLEDIRRATERAFPEFGPVDASAAAALVGEGARALVRRHFERNLPDLVPDADAFQRAITEGLARFKAAYRPHLVDNSRPFDGIVPLVRELSAAGCLVAVATNKPGDWGREMIDALMPDLFLAVVGPDDAGAHKPSPAMLAHVEQTLDAKMVAYVGDSVVDIQAAAAHGTDCIAVTYGLAPAAALHVAAAETGAVVVDDVPTLRQRLLERLANAGALS